MEINKRLDTDNDIEFLESGTLAHASNIVVNTDNGGIQNENAIEEFVALPDGELIVGHIACSNEFILFTNKNRIIRYNEKEGTQKEVVTNWTWGGGRVFGDYTYNVNNELIVAISEHNPIGRVPLKSINLDEPNFDNFGDESKYTLNPPIPNYNLRAYNLVNGSGLIYNGTYALFIRFFNNEYDYTHWFKLGAPIIVYNEVAVKELENSWYVAYKNSDNTNYMANVILKDEYSSASEKNSKTIQLVIDIFDKTNTYKYYQIGYVLTTVKHETIAIVEGKTDIGNNIYNLTNKQDDKYTISIDEMTSTFFNLYNVNTLCNYQNRLYVADYIEENANSVVDQIDTSGIEVSFVKQAAIDDFVDFFSRTRSAEEENKVEDAEFEELTEPFSAKIDAANIPINSITGRANAIEYVWNNPDRKPVNSDFELDKEYKCYIQALSNSTKVYMTDCQVYEVGIYNRTQIDANTIGVDLDYCILIPIKAYYKARGILKDDTAFLRFTPYNDEDTQLFYGNIDNIYIAFRKADVGRYAESNYAEAIYAYRGVIINIPDFNNRKNTEIIFDFNDVDPTVYTQRVNIWQYRTSSVKLDNGYTAGQYINVYNIAYNDRILINNYVASPDRKWAITENVYNFFIHYVYPNGSYTDGIRINNNVKVNYNINLGKKADGSYVYYTINNDTTIEDCKTYSKNNGVTDTTNAHAVTKIFTDDIQDVYFINVFPESYSSNNTTPYRNNKGETFFRPISSVNNGTDIAYGYFRFSNIPMYKDFVGYFISYEETEPILCARAIVGSIDTNISVISRSGAAYFQDFITVGANAFNFVKLGAPFTYTVGYNKEVGLYGTNYYGGYYLINSPWGDDSYDAQYDGLYAVVNKTIQNPGEIYNGSPARINFTLNRDTNFTPIKDIDINNHITTYTYKRMGLLYNYTNEIYTNTNKKLISLGYIVYDEYIENKPGGYTYGSSSSIKYDYDYYVYTDKYEIQDSNGTTRRNFKYELVTIPLCGLMLTDGSPYPLRGDNGQYYYPNLPTENWPANNFFHMYGFHIIKIGFPFVSRYMYHCRTLKTEPVTRAFTYYHTDGSGNTNWSKNFTNKNIVPDKIDNLFELNSAYYDYTDKILTSFNKDVYSNYVTNYKKTIRRSDVISDENVENNWRTFRAEEYKVIAENKGNIVNVVGIGSYLIAHCEHSMFIFNRDSSMKTENKDVQLVIPDAFGIDYVEVFTSNKGYAGIQKHGQFICSNYGYIFYDNDARKLYRYDENNLEDITAGFKHLLTKEVTDINFAIDEKNVRLLCLGKVKSGDTEEMFAISYSFLHKAWISTHTYWYDYLFNTKDNVYFANESTIDKFNFAKFNNYINLIDNTSNYFNGEFKTIEELDEEGGIINTHIVPYSFIDVIFNNQNMDTVLNYISYIINKDRNDNYCGDELVIYTNCCFSDYVDISKPKESMKDYKHPYYRYGIWFMNWFRNVIKEIKTIPPVDRHTGKYNEVNKQLSKLDNKLIVGKYFAIRFIFRDENKTINIDDIQCY